MITRNKKLPVVIYADFESSLVTTKNCKIKGAVALHEANTYRIHIHSDVDLGIPVDYEYSGVDADVHFVDLLINKLEKQIQTKLQKCCEKHKEPKLTKEEEEQFKNATECIFCKNKLGEDRVRDHCHFTGKYEGASHNTCNIKAYQSFKGKVNVPVFFHNANYDIRCFISAFEKISGTEFDVTKIGGIPCNMEIYKCLNINSFTICDSYAHLSSSLDSLIKNLPDDKKHKLRTLATTDEQFSLINKKGLYPYEMITSLDKLNISITELKPSMFKSKLNLSRLSMKEWEHIKEVIKVFNIKILKNTTIYT